MATREQERAQKAYVRILVQQKTEKEADYKRFSKSFPALIHNNGLAQALAFGQAKAPPSYMEDLAHVAGQMNDKSLADKVRTAPLPLYQKLSRDTLAAATWLKRYAEALLKGDDE